MLCKGEVQRQRIAVVRRGGGGLIEHRREDVDFVNGGVDVIRRDRRHRRRRSRAMTPLHPEQEVDGRWHRGCISMPSTLFAR